MSLSIMLGLQPFVEPKGRVRIIMSAEMQDRRKKSTVGHKPVGKGTITRSREISIDIVKFMIWKRKALSVDDIRDGIGASRTAIRRILTGMEASGKASSRAIGHNKHLYKLVKDKP